MPVVTKLVAQFVDPLADGGDHPFGRQVAPFLVGHQFLFSLGLHRIDHPTVLRRIVLIHLVERGGTPTAMFMYDTLLDHFLVTRIVTTKSRRGRGNVFSFVSWLLPYYIVSECYLT